jgi:hypothetical protein
MDSTGKVATLAAPKAPEQPTAFQQAAEIAGPIQSGSFVPEELTGLQGDFFSAVRTGWNDGLIGYATRPDEVNVADRDKLEAQALNYSQNYGFRSFVGNMLGGAASDAPIEAALLFAGGPLLGVTSKAARAAGAVKAAKRMDRAREVARGFASGSATRMRDRLAYEGTMGALAGVASVGAQSSLGREFTAAEAIERVASDAIGSALFSEAIRAGVKAFGWTVQKARRKVKDGLKPDIDTKLLPQTAAAGADATDLTPPDRTTIIPPGDEAIELGPVPREDTRPLQPVDTEGGARLQADERIAQQGEDARLLNLQRQEGEGRIEPEDTLLADDVAVVAARVAEDIRQKTGEGSSDLKGAIRRFNADRSRENLLGVFDRILDPEGKKMANDLADFMEAKARAGRMTLKQYLDKKGFEFKGAADEVSVEFESMRSTINAVENATSVGDFIHELGHVYRADLSDAHVGAIESAYGIKDGMWDRAAEEKFADDFKKWVAQGDDAEGFTRPLRRAFKALSDWIRETVGSLLGKGVDTSKVAPEVAQVFEEMFQRVGDSRANAPTAAKEARVFAQRQEAGTTQLKATGADELEAEIQRREADLPPGVQKVQTEAKELVDASSKSIDEAPTNPKTSKTKRVISAIKNLPAMAGFRNYSYLGFVKAMGPAVAPKVERMLKRGLNMSAKIQNQMRDKLKALNLSDDFIFDKSTQKVNLGDKTIDMSATDRRSLYMRLLHGLDKNLNPLPRKDTSYKRLVRTLDKNGEFTKPDGVFIGDEKFTFSEEDAMRLIKSEDLVSAQEKKVLGKVFEIYQSIVPEANRLAESLTGKKIFSSKDVHYSPIVSEADLGEPDLVSFSGILGGKGAKADIAISGALKNRATEGHPILLRNPFEQLDRYIKSVPDALSYAQPARIMSEILKRNAKKLEDIYGRAFLQSAQSLTKNLVGDRSGFNKPMGAVGSYVVKIANLSKLSLNIGTSAKQLASIGSAKAARVITMDTKSVAADALGFIKDKEGREKLINEAKSRVPFFKARQEAGVAFLDDDLLNSAEFSTLMATRQNEPTAVDLLKLAQKSKIKAPEAWAEMVSRGLFMIKHVDEATMAALWKAAKESPEAATKSPEKLFTDLILASQPSYDKLSRSMNQMERDLLSRSLASFSTQTRKNFELGFSAIYEYANGKISQQEMFDIIGPLAGQTAYATAAGGVSTFATAFALSQLSDKKQKELEKDLDDRALDLTRKFVIDIVGQTPVSGNLAAYMLNRATGGAAFSTDIIGIDEFEQGVDAITSQEPSKIARALGNFVGSSTVGKVAAATLD